MSAPLQPMLMTGLLDQARVRVLLVPIVPAQSTIEHSASFQQYARQLAMHNAVLVADLKSGAITSSSSSSATTGSRWNEGKIRFNFITELPREHEYLEEFQPYRQVLGVIGVACCAHFDNIEQIHKEFQANTKDVNTYLERFMQDFGQLLLDAFGIMIAAIERRTIISTPDIGRPATPTGNTSSNPGGSSNSTGSSYSQPPTSMNSQLQQTASSYFRTASPAGTMTGTSSINSSGNAASNEAKARKRTPGRAQKLIGDLMVLSGRLPESVVAYISAIDQARSGGDYLWQAASMEGLCATIGLLSLTDAPDVGPLPSLNIVTSTSYGFTFDPAAPMTVTSTETLRKFLGEIPSRYREIALMYERAQVWPVVYVEACLKMARFSITNETGRRWRTEEASIWIARAWNYAGDLLEVGEKIVFGTVAADLLAEAGANLTSQLFPLLHQTAIRDDLPREEIIQRLIDCLNRVCPAYGIENYTPEAAEVRVACEEEQLDPNSTFGWAVLQVDVLRECVRVCEIIRDHDRMVHYATQLLRRRRDYLHRDDQARIAGSLHRMVATAVNSGMRKMFYGLFWHNGFLRHLETCKPLDHRRPHMRKRRVASGTETGSDPFIYNPFAKKSAEDTRKMIWVVNEPVYTMVTLWNPFAFDLELQEIRLITSGIAFESETAAALIPAGAPLTLRLSGTPKESGQLSILGCSVVAFGGVYEEFYIRSPFDDDGTDDSDGSKRTQATDRQKTQLAIRQRPKRSGLDAFNSSIESLNTTTNPLETSATTATATTSTSTPITPTRPIDVQVISEMPLVRVKNTTLNHGAVMLCEGETTTMTITLENIGRETVNFILPVFLENPTPPPTGNHQLRPSKEDTYEQDRFLAYTHAFRWPLTQETGEDSTRVTILPGHTFDLTIGLYGKRNSTGGSIQIDYGCEQNETTSNDDNVVVYTRQLSIPVLLTVRRTLELLNADVLSVNQRDTSLSDADAMAMVNQMIQHRRDQWCLLTLDIRNIWSTPFHLQFDLNKWTKESSTEKEGEDKEEEDSINKSIAHTSIMIQPGSAKRILIPVERLALREEAEQPIPLVNKQFVVDKGPKPTVKEEQLTRQLFWYKEKMLQQITAKWTCSPGKEGTFDLRAIRLTEPMLDVLRSDDIVFSTSMTCDDEHDTITSTDGRFTCQVEQFYTLNINLRNCQDHPVKLFFRAQPLLDYCNGQKSSIYYNIGQLQCILPEIAPDDEHIYRLPVYFLRCGRYTLACHVEDIRTNIVHLHGELEFDVQPPPLTV
ncbi:TRAPP II complex [Syncephalis plumigaleata]|nr:TRAPP II complex [Syncephalis plumigaleata]